MKTFLTQLKHVKTSQWKEKEKFFCVALNLLLSLDSLNVSSSFKLAFSSLTICCFGFTVCSSLNLL